MPADVPFDILLIEDNPDDRQLFARAVRLAGIPARVSVATTASDAITRLNRLGAHQDTPLPQLIVMDLGLPGISGQAVLQAIRTACGPHLVPVVVLTGSDAGEDRAVCDGLVINAYLVKPDSLAALVDLVATLPTYLERPSTDRISRLVAALSDAAKPVGE